MRYLCGLILLLALGCSNQDAAVVSSNFRETTRDELKQAMHYHGVLFAERDVQGEWYFFRKGKRCRLLAYVDARKN